MTRGFWFLLSAFSCRAPPFRRRATCACRGAVVSEPLPHFVFPSVWVGFAKHDRRAKSFTSLIATTPLLRLTRFGSFSRLAWSPSMDILKVPRSFLALISRNFGKLTLISGLMPFSVPINMMAMPIFVLRPLLALLRLVCLLLRIQVSLVANVRLLQLLLLSADPRLGLLVGG